MARYTLVIQGQAGKGRTFSAETDDDALFMALTIIKGKIMQQGGRGIRWALFRQTFRNGRTRQDVRVDGK